MKISRLTFSELLFYFCVFAFVAESILKYQNTSWLVNEYGTLASNVGKVLGEWKILQICLISVLFFISFPIKKNILTVCGVILSGSGFIWLANDAKDISIMYFQMTSVTLIVMGMILIIAQNSHVYLCFKKLCPLLAVFYTIICLFSCIDFKIHYPGMRMADGYIIEYFIYALFLTGIWCSISDRSNVNNFLVYFCCGTLVFCAFIITSRGWLIQSILLLIFCYFTFSKNSIPSRILKIALLIIFIYLLYSFMQYIIGNQVQFMASRFSEDTRSNQMNQFLRQVSLTQLIVGQGVDASYIFKDNRYYRYIDNQFLFMMFRYGIISLIAYLIPFFYSFIKIERKKLWLKNNFVLIMWLLAMGGLSIYCSIKIDIVQFFLLIKVEGNMYENDLLTEKTTKTYKNSVVGVK